jgi:hypothetical protein
VVAVVVLSAGQPTVVVVQVAVLPSMAPQGQPILVAVAVVVDIPARLVAPVALAS